MKVLHFFKTYYPDSYGGIEQVIYQLAEGGRGLGVQAQVLSLSQRGAFRDVPLANHITHGSKLDLYLASTGFSFSALRDFKELVRQVDIVHYHFPWPFMDIMHFLARVNKPTVLTYHSDVVRQKMLLQIYRPLMNHFLACVDCIVATSPNYLASSPVLSHFSGKVQVIPLGIDRRNYPLSSAEKLQAWRETVGDCFFLFVGALRYYKGLHTLLDAMAGVDLPVVIVGGGPEELRLKAQADTLGLQNVHFVGALPDEDKAALLELCYGLVFPSHLRSEAFGISLLEGAMYGKPLISCEIGTGTTYINVHDETGLVVPPCDAPALRNAMQKLWDRPDLAALYGCAAHQRYLDLFTAEKMVGQYVEIYQALLAKHDASTSSGHQL